MYWSMPWGKKERRKNKENVAYSYCEQFFAYSEVAVIQQHIKDFEMMNQIASKGRKLQNVLECCLWKKGNGFYILGENQVFH